MAPIQTCNLSPEDVIDIQSPYPTLCLFGQTLAQIACVNTPTFSQTKESPGELSQEPEQGLLDPQNHVKLCSEKIKELGQISRHPEILFYCQAANGHW